MFTAQYPFVQLFVPLRYAAQLISEAHSKQQPIFENAKHKQ